MKNLWTYSEIHFNRFLHKSVESTKRSILEIRNSNFESKLFRARTRISSTGWISFKTVSFSASDIFSTFIWRKLNCHELEDVNFLKSFLKMKLFCRNCLFTLEISKPRYCHTTSNIWNLGLGLYRKRNDVKNQISQFRLLWFGRNKKTIGKKRNFLKIQDVVISFFAFKFA